MLVYINNLLLLLILKTSIFIGFCQQNQNKLTYCQKNKFETLICGVKE